MKLFMDIGNSSVMWASAEGLAQGKVQRASTKDLPDSLIMGLADLESPAAVHIASVLQPERTAELCRWIENRWGISPVFAVTRAAELDVVNGYRPPECLGIDRWLGLLAARALFREPLLVIDCGTATTLDVLEANGRHLGGVILPGLRLFRRCLRTHTDIPPIDGDGEIGDFATDTAAGIASGAMLATTSAVEAMLERVRQASGRQPRCLLTGGMASQVTRYLAAPHRLVPHLILQGLSLQVGQKERP